MVRVVEVVQALILACLMSDGAGFYIATRIVHLFSVNSVGEAHLKQTLDG